MLKCWLVPYKSHKKLINEQDRVRQEFGLNVGVRRAVPQRDSHLSEDIRRKWGGSRVGERTALPLPFGYCGSPSSSFSSPICNLEPRAYSLYHTAYSLWIYRFWFPLLSNYSLHYHQIQVDWWLIIGNW